VRGSRIPGLVGAVLVGLVLLPLVALVVAGARVDFGAALADPMFLPALALSVRTSLLAMALVVLLGTPLAWWLATRRTRIARAVELAVALPIVVPPAVIGVALLMTYGRQGLLGPFLANVGVTLPFTEPAVVLAQVVVAAPFYVQAAASGFREVDPELLVVARSLGATPTAALRRVAIPIAMPGLVVGASLAWARALGEFGATLVFAGNMRGETQTLPLAIFQALESDVRVAVVFSLVLVAVGALLLGALRFAPRLWGRR